MSGFLYLIGPAVLVVALMLLFTVRLIRRGSLSQFVTILVGGVVVIVGIVLLVIAGLEPMVAAEIAACEAASDTYDCEDAGLLLALPIMSGAAAAALWILSTLCLRFIRGTTNLRTGDAS